MSRKPHLLHRAAGIFSVLGAAISAAGAIDSRRRPADRDIRALGIDPVAFATIRR